MAQCAHGERHEDAGRAAQAGRLRFDSEVPLLFFVYGGPGNAQVKDVWGGYYLWHTMLTQKGYLVASGGQPWHARPLGRAWRKAIYGQLGVLETRDQAAAARFLPERSYVDPDRVGIWGWSYGGFMSLNVLFQHPDLYRTAVAVSPVTNWKLYDNVYTERFNGLITDNAAGYERGSPITYVNGLRGNLLLVHGGGDDNVHFQNSEILINALVAANKPFTMMEYPNRTHCICQGKNTTAHLFALDHEVSGPESDESFRFHLRCRACLDRSVAAVRRAAYIRTSPGRSL